MPRCWCLLSVTGLVALGWTKRSRVYSRADSIKDHGETGLGFFSGFH
jgi:hypothetical protein